MAKEAKARVYLVTDLGGKGVTAVKARNADQALGWATRGQYSVRPATVDDFVRKEDVQDATVPGVHPDQQPLEGLPPA